MTDESPTSSWKGRAIETLVAAQCILASEGRLNVSTPFVDDEGVDLVFNIKGTPKILSVQVKSRFSSTSLMQRKSIYRAQVRRKVFAPRDDLYLLFVLFDNVSTFAIQNAWLVPSMKFAELTGGQKDSKQHLVFAVHTKGAKNMWVEYRRTGQDLADGITAAIEQIDVTRKSYAG